MPVTFKRYSAAEREVFAANYATCTAEELMALLPGRTLHSFRQQAKRMGLSKSRETYSRIIRNLQCENPWTQADIGMLRALYPAAPWSQIHAALPGRTPQQIRGMAGRIGVKRDMQARRDSHLESMRRVFGEKKPRKVAAARAEVPDLPRLVIVRPASECRVPAVSHPLDAAWRGLA